MAERPVEMNNKMIERGDDIKLFISMCRTSHVLLTTIRYNRIIRCSDRESFQSSEKMLTDSLKARNSLDADLLTLGGRFLIDIIATLPFNSGDKICEQEHRQKGKIAPPDDWIAQQIDAEVATREVLTLKVENEENGKMKKGRDDGVELGADLRNKNSCSVSEHKSQKEYKGISWMEAARCILCLMRNFYDPVEHGKRFVDGSQLRS